MKARTVALKPTIPGVIGVEVVALAGLAIFPPTRATWWPAVVITVAAIAALLVTVHGRSAVGWLAALVRWWRRRRRGPFVVPAAVDIPHGSQLYGVRIVGDEPLARRAKGGAEAITMVAVSGQAYSPTVLTGSATALTPNRLPLDALTELLDQPGGIRLAAIDVVSSGVRVRRGIGYPPLYSTLLADRPAAGQRSTWIVVRLDISRSTDGLGYRSSVGAAAAAATERIVNALLQREVRATALTARDLDAALTELGAGLVRLETSRGDVVPPTPTEAWRTVRACPGFLSSYYFSPEDVTTNTLNQMWALHSDAVVQTVSLTKKRARSDGQTRVSAAVRLSDPQPPANPPTLYLNPLPGDQAPAAVLGVPAMRWFDRAPARPLVPGELEIPVGSSGVLVGTTLRGDLLLMALTDPEQSTRIGMQTSMAYTRQLLVRAAAVGERIAIYTDEPDRWTTLEQPLIAVVDREHPPEFVPTIIVSDRASGPPPAGLASTVISLGDAEADAACDISFIQTSPSMVQITTAAFSADVHIATFKAEQPFLGQTVEQMAT